VIGSARFCSLGEGGIPLFPFLFPHFSVDGFGLAFAERVAASHALPSVGRSPPPLLFFSSFLSFFRTSTRATSFADDSHWAPSSLFSFFSPKRTRARGARTMGQSRTHSPSPSSLLSVPWSKREWWRTGSSIFSLLFPFVTSFSSRGELASRGALCPSSLFPSSFLFSRSASSAVRGGQVSADTGILPPMWPSPPFFTSDTPERAAFRRSRFPFPSPFLSPSSSPP